MPNHESYEAMAHDENVDVVYVATPHTMHERHAMLYLSSGKSVLVEKPFAVNQTQAIRMIDVARASGLFLMEAMWSRYLPSYKRLRDVLEQGIIGTVRMVDASLGYRTPAERAQEKFDLQKGGGSLLDLGVYPVQLSSFVLGQPDCVVAAGHLGPTGVDEQTAAVLHHPDGALGIIRSSISTTLACSARIIGTDGTIELPAFMHCLQHLSIIRPDGSDQVDCANVGNGLQYEAEHVQNCLRSGLTESPDMTLDETSSIMHTLDVIRQHIGLVYPGDSVVSA